MKNKTQKANVADTTAALALCLSLCIAAPAQAQPADQDRLIGDTWKYEVTPYLWAAGVSGTARAGPRVPAVNVDADFSDILDSLDAGLMGSFEARKDRWGVLFDLLYIKLSKDSRPLLGGRLGTAEGDVTEKIGQLAGAYRVSNNPITPVDVLLGVRYASVDTELNLSASPLLPSGASRSRNASWTDGFVGARVEHQLSDRWMLTGYADIGGGGSEKSWQALAGANYNFSNAMTAKFGYRILSMDYDKPEFLYNLKTAGVYAGLGIKF